MLKDEIEKVLEELLYKACLKCPDEDNDDGHIKTALTHILELVEKCVPEKKLT